MRNLLMKAVGDAAVNPICKLLHLQNPHTKYTRSYNTFNKKKWANALPQYQKTSRSTALRNSLDIQNTSCTCCDLALTEVKVLINTCSCGTQPRLKPCFLNSKGNSTSQFPAVINGGKGLGAYLRSAKRANDILTRMTIV